jgi:hypothetical protein
VLEAALAELMAVIGATGGGRAPDGARLAAAMEQVEGAGRELSGDVPTELRHYLRQRSYQKALNFLRTGDAEPGLCP